VSYAAGIAWSFVWNRRWTFRSQGPAVGQAVRFTVLQVASWLLSTAQIHVAVNYLGLPEWPSWVAVTGFITVVNFLGSRYWAFRERAGVEEGPA
jgi:putative flippase GtrA